MLRTVRTIAAATMTIWGAAALADDNPATTGSTAQAQTPSPATPVEPSPAPVPQAGSPPGPIPAPGQAPVQPVPPPPVQATPAPAQTPATPAGTPATVLDTQDYEGILGKGVRNVAGEDMGRIIDIVLDKDGRPRAAIIDFGGFLGVGSRKIAVDWRTMRFSQEGKPGRPVLQLTRNQVRVSPEYKPGEPIVVLGPASPSVPADVEQTVAAPAATPAAVAPALPPAAPASDKPASAPTDKPPEKAPDR